MTREVRLLRVGEVDARRELATVAAVMRAVAEARDRGAPFGALVMADLSGNTEALGRWQAPGDVTGPLLESFVRRWTGGHGTVYGDGILSVCAVLPEPGAWLEEPGPLPADRALNRYSRGLLRGISRLGVQAAYPGRDFLTVSRRNAAYLSAERDARGVLLVQAVLAVETEYALEAEPPLGAGLPPVPPPTTLAEELDDADISPHLQTAIAEGYAAQFRLDLAEWPAEEAGRALAADPGPLLAVVPPDEERLSFARGEEVEIPIGSLEAFARVGPKGRLERVRLAGDWIAGSAGVAALEAALAGALPERPTLAKLVAPIVADPAHLFIGIDSPDSIVEAVLRAAAAAGRARA
jgi:hypothetical protein